MNNFCFDVGYMQSNKYHEEICGDHIEMSQNEQGEIVLVLADGLGSGVKANILSTITAKILSTMLVEDMKVSECIQTIAATLPICKERKIAYSTFSVVKVQNNKAKIIEYDNPGIVVIRNHEEVILQKTKSVIYGKNIYFSELELEQGDILLLMSDGVVHAGVGNQLNFGFTRSEIVKYLLSHDFTNVSSKSIAVKLINKCRQLYESKFGDDASCAVISLRERIPVNLLIGPPALKQDDKAMLDFFFSKEGYHIVCGGTTAKMAAKYLQTEIESDFSLFDMDKEIPPISTIEGVDLTTEGVITISKVLSYAKDYVTDNKLYKSRKKKMDGASRISRYLFDEATDIHFYVGRAINPAHQNPQLPIDFNIKMQLIEELSQVLKQMGKHVKVSYF